MHVGPEERFFAKMRAMQRDKNDPELMEAWKQDTLTESFEFWVIETNQDRYMAAYELRDNVSRDFKALALTPYQKCFTVIGFKAKVEATRGRLSTKAAFQLYYLEYRPTPTALSRYACIGIRTNVDNMGVGGGSVRSFAPSKVFSEIGSDRGA